MEEEESTEEAAPVKIASSATDFEPAPDEEGEDTDDETPATETAPVSSSANATQAAAPAQSPSHTTDEADRWAGTMSHEWNEKDEGPVPEVPQAPKPKAKARPKITLEEAVAKIPPEALQYIRDKFKTDVNHIHAYDPSNNVKTRL